VLPREGYEGGRIHLNGLSGCMMLDMTIKPIALLEDEIA